MRRFVSGLCLTLLFVAVSLAQTAYFMSATLFDTGAFHDAVRSVASDPAVRTALGDDLAAVLAQGHDLSPRQSAEVRDAVNRSVAGAPFADELAGTLARVHAALLAGRNPAAALDLSGVQQDLRHSLAQTDPRLAAALPADKMQRGVDPGRLPWVPSVVDAVGAALPYLLGAALAFLVVAVAVAEDRPRALRRGGYVLVAGTLWTLLARVVLPALLVPLMPSGVVRTLGGALTARLLGALMAPMVVTAAAGLVLVAAGVAWGRARSRRPQRVRSVPAPLRGVPVRARTPAQAPAPLPVAGPPIANVAVMSPAAPVAAAPPPRGPTERYEPADASTPAAPVSCPDTVENGGGWGPLRH